MQVMVRINAAALNKTGRIHEICFYGSVEVGNNFFWQLLFFPQNSLQVSECRYQPLAQICNNFPSLICIVFFIILSSK